MNLESRKTEDVLDAVIEAVRAAHAAVLEVYGSDFPVDRKADASPVTEADRRSEAVIVDALARLDPAVPVVAEESVSVDRAPADRFWLVDPLDGTREFVARNGEFTVNVGLIQAGSPVLGVLGVPAHGLIYAGASGVGAWLDEGAGRRAIRCRVPPHEGLTVLSSRSHDDPAAVAQRVAGERVAALRRLGSSWKFALIAQGQADLYPRIGRTMEWDTAAGHALLVAAGGSVADEQGRPLRYGKPGLAHAGFVARGLAGRA